MHLLQKIQTLTDAPEGKTMHQEPGKSFLMRFSGNFQFEFLFFAELHIVSSHIKLLSNLSNKPGLCQLV